MNKIESEIELRATEERSATAAAPKDLKFPLIPLQHQERLSLVQAALLAVHMDFQLSTLQ